MPRENSIRPVDQHLAQIIRIPSPSEEPVSNESLLEAQSVVFLRVAHVVEKDANRIDKDHKAVYPRLQHYVSASEQVGRDIVASEGQEDEQEPDSTGSGSSNLLSG